MTAKELKNLRALKYEIKRDSERLNLLKEHEGTEELRKELSEHNKKSILLETKLTKEIDEIPDANIRTAIKRYYLDGYTWDEVAGYIGGGNTEDSCKKMVSRYILSHMSHNSNL